MSYYASVRIRNEDGTDHADPVGGKLPVSIEEPLLVSVPEPLEVKVMPNSSDILDYYMRRDINPLVFDGTQTMDSYTIDVVDATGVSVGNLIRIQEGDRLFQATILSISVNELTIDTPLDYPFTSVANVAESSKEMNVDGSSTPISFWLGPTQPGQIWDVTRIMFSMTHSLAADYAKFGDLSELTNGLVLRKSNGIHHTIFNVKSNGGFEIRTFDVKFTDRAGGGPGSAFGTSARRTFSGDDKNWATIRLYADLGDRLEILIQDDLTGLSSFNSVLQGNIVLT